MEKKCNISEQIKICIVLIILITTCILIITGICVYIKNSIDSDKQDFEELVKHSSKTYVRNGYWLDKQRSCSIDNPCIMNCLEYSRFIIGCGPDNPTCTHGHYDWCKDKPSRGQI